jgi:hypothetical protein
MCASEGLVRNKISVVYSGHVAGMVLASPACTRLTISSTLNYPHFGFAAGRVSQSNRAGGVRFPITGRPFPLRPLRGC